MKFIRQNDPAWGKELLGHSATTTIGRSGCLLVALTVAYNELCSASHTPLSVQRLLLSKNPNSFKGSMLVLEIAANILGLVCLEKERLRSVPGDPRLPDRVLAGLGIDLPGDFAKRPQSPPLMINRTPLAKGVTVGGGAVTAGSAGLCILHVDHDKDTLGGDIDGDHFLNALEWKNGRVECLDPATGKVCYLDDRTLKGDSQWGAVTKHFTVVGTIPIRRAS